MPIEPPLSRVFKYFGREFFRDLKAGFITAIVALPLAIAFAIASGVSPIMGLYTAVIAGALGSLFGGSRFSITGPTGAMTVIILSTVNQFGLEGLLLAGLLAGLLQILFGIVRLGKLVKFIPLPVVSGFTAGIGIIILTGQIPNLLGLELHPREFFFENIWQIIDHASQTKLTALAIGLVTLAMLLFLPMLTAKLRALKEIPPSILALIATTLAVYGLNLALPVVGQIPTGLPVLQLFPVSLELVRAVLPAAFTIALLGSIEALLCAVVCDGMSNTRHHSNQELVAQGIANVVLPFFGAIPSTAAIARSAINIREGAVTRFAGVLHALILLLILLFLGPVAQHVPKAFLAGILIFVSLRMINIAEMRSILRISREDGFVLFLTLALTVIVDLVFAIQIGMLLAILLLFLKFTNLLQFDKLEEHDLTDEINQLLEREYAHLKDRVSVYTIHGPFFFGAMGLFEQKIQEHINLMKPYILLRMRHVPLIDSTGVESLKSFIRDQHSKGKHVFLINVQPDVKAVLKRDHEFKELMRGERVFNRTRNALEYLDKNGV